MSPAAATPPSELRLFTRAQLAPAASTLTRTRVTVVFEDATLSTAEEAHWADLIDKGIADIEQYLGVSMGSQPLLYIVTGRVGLTSRYVPGPRPHVDLSLDRVRKGAAPYLHEAVHHLIALQRRVPISSTGHLWLIEGLPSYVEDAVAEVRGGQPGRVFNVSGNAGVDRDAATYLKTPIGGELSAFIGRTGSPDLTDREARAKPFYVMAQSFTKYIIERVSLARFTQDLLPVMLNAPRFEQSVKEVSGQTLEQLRSRWLADLEQKGKSLKE